MAHPSTPVAVRTWTTSSPPWLSIHTAKPGALVRTGAAPDPGERAVLALALEMQPDLMLMDDRAGVMAAHQFDFVVTGTLGLLLRAARHGLLDLPVALDKLGRTSFHWTPSLRASVLAANARDLQ